MVVWVLNNFEDLCCLRQSENKQSSQSEHQVIALIDEGSQNEQHLSSDWFDVAIVLI